ncbi:hypothetical protein HHE02_17760 [Helicobacter heilmannii]|nr:hypothetical protein HHE02_17760 [Helicobacter heilmannii]
MKWGGWGFGRAFLVRSAEELRGGFRQWCTPCIEDAYFGGCGSVLCGSVL